MKILIQSESLKNKYRKGEFGEPMSLPNAVQEILLTARGTDEQLERLRMAVIALVMCCAHRTNNEELLNKIDGRLPGQHVWEEAK